MAAITKIEFWNDIGFIDGAVEIPSISAPDPTNPDITIEPEFPIIPSRERMFSELKLKEYFTELLTVSYMRVTYTLKNSLGIDTTKIFYGWVTDVSISSDSDLPMTTISWHIDEWRTWKSAVSFGSGHVKRRPFYQTASTPIQNYPYRYLKLPGYFENSRIYLTDRYFGGLSGNEEIFWVIFSFNEKKQVQEPGGVTRTVTETIYGTYPVLKTTRSTLANVNFKKNGSQTVHLGLTFNETLMAKMDEYLGIDPEAFNGIWLSPISPFIDGAVTGTGATSLDPLIIDTTDNIISHITSGNTYSYIVLKTDDLQLTNVAVNQQFITKTKTLTSPLEYTEFERYFVQDMDNVKFLDFPYSVPISSVDVTLVIEATSCYVIVSLKDGLAGRLEGWAGITLLPDLPLNTNAQSSYVYSGQREYDREARTIRSNADAWKSTSSGASTGGLFGAVGNIGALGGLAAGAAPGLISYGVEMLYQNDAEQSILDRLKANQTPGLIMGDNCLLSLYGGEISIMKLEMDSYSTTQATNMRSLFGISVDELMTSCDTMLKQTMPTGYYNIQNLIVTGDIPVSAKKWIREKFRAGVRLK